MLLTWHTPMTGPRHSVSLLLMGNQTTADDGQPHGYVCISVCVCYVSVCQIYGLGTLGDYGLTAVPPSSMMAAAVDISAGWCGSDLQPPSQPLWSVCVCGTREAALVCVPGGRGQPWQRREGGVCCVGRGAGVQVRPQASTDHHQLASLLLTAPSPLLPLPLLKLDLWSDPLINFGPRPKPKRQALRLLQPFPFYLLLLFCMIPSKPSLKMATKAPTAKSAIDFLQVVQKLKTTKRTGWIRKGVEGPESIAGRQGWGVGRPEAWWHGVPSPILILNARLLLLLMMVADHDEVATRGTDLATRSPPLTCHPSTFPYYTIANLPEPYAPPRRCSNML